MTSNEFIPLSIPNLGGNAVQYVTEAVETGWVSTAGPQVTRFEEAFAEYLGVPYAVSCMNGTAALHIALLLCGVKPNDEVLVPNLTFVATANAVRYCFAHPIFMDSEWSTLGMDPDKLAAFLKTRTYIKDGHVHNKSTDRRIKAILPMHTLGYPVDLDPLLALCADYNIDVIEDAAESLGSHYRDRKTGTFGKLACFSFNGNKIMTTGGGGMIVTSDETLAARAKHLTTTAKTDPVEYDHDEVGYNYRMVNVLAALGLAQLEQIEAFIETKRNNHALYTSLIEPETGFCIHTEADHARSNYWMVALVLSEVYPFSVRRLVDHLSRERIQARPIWKLMSTLPMYRNCESYHCDVSRDIYNRTVCLPSSTSLTRPQIERVVKTIIGLA